MSFTTGFCWKPAWKPIYRLIISILAVRHVMIYVISTIWVKDEFSKSIEKFSTVIYIVFNTCCQLYGIDSVWVSICRVFSWLYRVLWIWWCVCVFVCPEWCFCLYWCFSGRVGNRFRWGVDGRREGVSLGDRAERPPALCRRSFCQRVSPKESMNSFSIGRSSIMCERTCRSFHVWGEASPWFTSTRIST